MKPVALAAERAGTVACRSEKGVHRVRNLGLLILAATLAFLLAGCAERRVAGMQDGYYTAEAASIDSHGWAEYVTIYVKDGKIVTVEYNAKNASGFIKSWDTKYMRDMNEADNTYPNKYARQYRSDLLNKQVPEDVDALSGATHSHGSFKLLARAAMRQSENGDASVAYVKLQE